MTKLIVKKRLVRDTFRVKLGVGHRVERERLRKRGVRKGERER